MKRTTNVLVATAAIAAIATAPAIAQTADEPTSSAGATAVEVDGVATVSGTDASRNGDGSGSSSSTVVGLGDETVVGGTQEGNGESGGEIFTTGEDSENGYLTVGGWEATVDDSSSDSSAAVLRGNLGGEGGISGSALESSSHAEDGSSNASTTGVTLDLGGGQLHLELLHASTSSDGTGESWILLINDQKILTSEQADGRCEIPADPLVHILCLYAHAIEGEDGVTGGTAGVADVAALDGNLTGGLFRADATQATQVGSGDITPPVPPAGDIAPPTPAGDGTLPRTGAGLATALLGLLSMGAGAGLRRFARR